MPKLKTKTPSYRLHKGSGQAVVTLSGKDIYLGVHGTDESHTEYRSGRANGLNDADQVAYILHFTDGSTGEFITEPDHRIMYAEDGSEFDYYGSSVAMNGGYAAIGEELFKLVPDDGAAGDEFGASAASSGRLALVGSYRDDDLGPGSGAVYIFDVLTGMQITKLTGEHGSESGYFGVSLAVGGDEVLIGAPIAENLDSVLSGMGYLYKLEQPTLPGDLDGDGFVGITDLNNILVAWNQSVMPYDLSSGDVSGDGFVGIEDLNAVLGNWNAGAPPTDTPNMPEPSTITTLLAGILLLHRRSA